MLLLLLLLTVSGVLSQLRDCPPFPVPKVGDIFYTSKSPSSSYPTLTMASLVCNEGFPFAGGCPMVGAPARGNVMYSNGLTVPMVPNGTNATLNCTFGPLEGISTMTCNNGSWIPDRFGQCPNATVSGAITAACISNAWAPSTLGTCGAMDDNSGVSYCSPLQAPAEGSIILSKGTLDFPVQSGVVAQLRHLTGANRRALAQNAYAVAMISSTMGIYNNNVFRRDVGPVVSRDVHGHDEYNRACYMPPANVLVLVMGTCEWVTPPPGNSELTCTNGRWIPPTFGTCAGAPGATAGAPCKPLTPSPNMGLIYRTDDRYRMGTVTQNLDHGTVLTVKCFNGTLSGACWPVLPPLGATLSYSSGNGLGLQSEGTTVTANCTNHAEIKGASVLVCVGNQWDPSSFGTCPLTSGNGIGLQSEGTTVTANCSNNAEIKGASVLVCVDGKWDPPSFGTCPLSATLPGLPGGDGSCLSVLPPLGGTVSFSSVSELGLRRNGTTATAKCNNNVEIEGASVLVCVGGKWDPPSFGTCPLSASLPGLATGGGSCLSILPPLGGTVSFSSGSNLGWRSEGTTATAKCNNNVEIKGASVLTCVGGRWDPSSFGTCPTMDVLAAGGEFVLLVGQCWPLLPPIGANISYSSRNSFGLQKHGTIAKLKCNNNAEVSNGASVAVCVNGRWDPSLFGSCLSGIGIVGLSNNSCLFGFIAPLNGRVTYSSTSLPYPAGTEAVLVCNSGYVVHGNRTAKCRNGAFSALGTCVPSTAV
ncbi:unnamed protein product [Nippostrongylus brasiliensis]|uniref:Sushi domain-containing protein n=1 Tax=Nippostrongylus brasiliensis TaxID=27835 RepID=A0A158R136_NIPBR|nr:unnamed protein product [Nippostrongylus brasiliensis]